MMSLFSWRLNYDLKKEETANDDRQNINIHAKHKIKILTSPSVTENVLTEIKEQCKNKSTN